MSNIHPTTTEHPDEPDAIRRIDELRFKVYPPADAGQYDPENYDAALAHIDALHQLGVITHDVADRLEVQLHNLDYRAHMPDEEYDEDEWDDEDDDVTFAEWNPRPPQRDNMVTLTIGLPGMRFRLTAPAGWRRW